MKAKKINLSADYLTALSTADLTTYHYKVLLLLAVQPMTQTQIADFLQTKKQNINKYVSELLKYGLLEVDRIEGKNKFLKAVNKFPKDSKPTNKDQMTLFEYIKIWLLKSLCKLYKCPLLWLVPPLWPVCYICQKIGQPSPTHHLLFRLWGKKMTSLDNLPLRKKIF